MDNGNAVSVQVPAVVGLAQSAAEASIRNAGLVVGVVRSATNTATPAGNVTVANPSVGTAVAPGSAVNLEVSSGPPVPVPNVVGLTRQAAEGILKNAGLAVGAIRAQHSETVPAGGVSGTNPDTGALVSPGSSVDLYLSSGPDPNWTQYIPNVLFAVLGLVVLGVIVYGVTQTGSTFLNNLAKKDVARGLITFLIAIATVGIAIILAISTLVLTEGDEGDKRFDRGKQVLTILIGVLGTIVGFYFGSAPDTQRTPLAITTTALPDGAANKPYSPTVLQATGGTPPLKWSVTPALPDGFTLDANTGTIGGTPKNATAQTKFTFTVMDSATPAISSPPTVLTLEVKQ